MIKRALGKLEFKTSWQGKKDVWLMSDLQPHVAIRLKNLFPKIAKEQTNNFVFAHEGNNCFDLDWFCDRFPLTISGEDQAKLRDSRFSYENMLEEIEQILLPDYKPREFVGLMPGKVVRPYQAQAVEVLMRRKGLLLGDKMGLGKTYSAMAAMLQPGMLPAAVVVKTHLPKQWEDAIKDFVGLRVHKINKTSPYDLPKADVYVFKYSQLSGWADIFATGFFKFAVYDEIQELRTGEESAKGRGAYVLSSNTEYRMGLSGTPIHNMGAEIFNIMRCIHENTLGERRDFMREWVGDDGKSLKDPDALGAFLRESQVFLRRTKLDVGQQVPPINKIIETISVDQKAIDDIQEVARLLAIKTVSGSFMERGQAARQLDLLARLTTGVAKAKSVAAYVKFFLDEGIPVLLGGWHREVYEIWLKELKEYNPVMFTGTESASQKQRSVAAFTSGESNLMIMSLRSGDGLNGLQFRCHVAVFGELDWSGQIHDQFVARLDREHQTEQVMAIYLTSNQGSDPPMLDLVARKNEQARGLLDPNAPVGKTYSNTSRVRELAKQFLDREHAKRISDDEVFAILPDAEMEYSS